MMLKLMIVCLCIFALGDGKPIDYFRTTDWYKAMGWCTHKGSRVLTGDFNGDGRADMLCHDNKGNKWVALANAVGQFTGTSWHKAMGWCYHAGAELHLGDFNGDGRTDMLCHDSAGYKWVSLANADGSFNGTSWEKAMGWCSHASSRLMIGDFNGDGRSDMLCYDKTTKWVSLAQPGGSFVGTSFQKTTGWCSHAGSSIYIADFDGNLRDDLLCHDNTGRNWVMLAQPGGTFTGRSDWHPSTRWCDGTGELHLGYLNGDKRADMVCNRKSDGYKWVAVAGSQVSTLFSGTSWEKAMGWCGATGTLFVADFNNDGKDDLLCHEQSTGKKWIADNHYPAKAACAPNPCQNGGQCIATRRRAEGYRCQCKDCYTGNVCQTAPDYFKSTDWYKAMGWCTHKGSRVLTGDFNGDGRADMLCHDNKGNKWVALANAAGQFTGTSWHKAMGWCYHAGAELHLGDFNGDGRTDMLCHDSAGYKWVSLANADGSFKGTSSWEKAMGWCSHAGSRLMIGDFNGDGRSDMLCYDKTTKWVSLAQPGGSFIGTSFQKTTGWCSHAGSSIYIADFDGNLRDDLLCHDNTGRNWVMLAQPGGTFTGRSDWHPSTRWCDGTGELHLGYLNGDKRADMVCNRKSDGYKWVAAAGSQVSTLFSGTSWEKAMGWCGATGTLFVADFNNDGKDDLLCHEQSTGKKWIVYNHYGVC